MRAERGFSFIELLVVTTIILILASAVQPLAKVTKSAKVLQPLGELLTRTVDQDADGNADEPAKGGGSLLGKFNLKSLVAKKPKEASTQAA